MDIGALVALGLLAAPVNVEPVVTFDPEPALMAATQDVTITYDFAGGWRAANGRPEPMVVTYTPMAEIVLPGEPGIARAGYLLDYWAEPGSAVPWKDGQRPTEDITLVAHWKMENTVLVQDKFPDIRNASEYFSEKYYESSGWHRVSSDFTSYHTKGKPVEVGSELFPKEDINVAIGTSGISSTYGGCGPLAMIGVLDHMSRNMDYSSTIDNPDNRIDRINLAYEVFKATPTVELGLPGSKSTVCYPWDYATAFNNLLENTFHLSRNNNIRLSRTLFGIPSAEEGENLTIASINDGFPATFCSGLDYPAGDESMGSLSDHYVNIYGWETWTGYDSYGYPITENVYFLRLNWGRGEDSVYFADEDMFAHARSSVIGYEAVRDSTIIRAEDFKGFINQDTGNGQYFFYEKEQSLVTEDGTEIETNRLRASYIEDKVFVLSPRREDAGTAFIEFEFPRPVSYVNLDLRLWSSNEGLFTYLDDTIGLYAPADSDTATRLFDTSELYYGDSQPMSNFGIAFDEPSTTFKIEAKVANPEGDRNKGRVCIGDIVALYE